MPVNILYGAYDPMMAQTTKDALRFRQHVLAANNAYPTLNEDPIRGNFEQQVAKTRFNTLIDKYKQSIGMPDAPPAQVMAYARQHLMWELMQSVQITTTIEASHRKELEDLAVQMVREDFNIKEGDVIFDIHLVGFGNVKFPDNIKLEEETMFDPPESLNYDADDEVQKRRFINALISGASKKGHYIFHLGRTELDRINPDLVPLYQRLMAANDLLYYTMPDEMARAGMASDDLKAGYEKITFNEDGIPVIKVEAVNFPTLLHEVIKAVVELIATLALPDEKAMLDFVYDEADFVFAEMWYLRLGPIFWERLLNLFPPEHQNVKSQILGKIFELETTQFNLFMRSVLSEEDKASARNQIQAWGDQIKDNIRSYRQSEA